MRPKRSPISGRHLIVLAAGLAGAVVSCSTTALFNLPAATSDFAPGLGQPTPRAVQVGFINNTPFRAIFTFGGYEPYDQDALPTSFGQLRLEGNTASAQVAQPCRKAFTVGGADLIRLITENEADPSMAVPDPQALIRGVNFSGAPVGDPLEAEPTEGTAEALDLLVGVDFTCNRTDIRQATGSGLLLFTFEQDAAAPGGFRIDYQFVAP
jgi:hypothetical protein